MRKKADEIKESVDLGSGKVSRLLFSLAMPTITSQIVNMLYNLVDRVYIGHMTPVDTVGKLALTGVGVCLPVIMVVSAFAALLGMAAPPELPLRRAGARRRSLSASWATALPCWWQCLLF